MPRIGELKAQVLTPQRIGLNGLDKGYTDGNCALEENNVTITLTIQDGKIAVSYDNPHWTTSGSGTAKITVSATGQGTTEVEITITGEGKIGSATGYNIRKLKFKIE